ncbi:hypothetical protein [Streptomyces sp. NPDC058295]|uniref:hypothetical protein n=1 Tax=Streptomyces sp. NPDC058295 TaxID=3346431 RepID=UPI0036E40485
MGDGPDVMEVLVEITALPRVDEHTTIITAEAADVWRGLGETLDRSFTRPGSATRASSAPPTVRPRGPAPSPRARRCTASGWRKR